MVRGSSLIFRLACLEYGADVVFSPGLVDLAIQQSTVKQESDGSFSLMKQENKGEKRIFHTTKQEEGKLIVQIVSIDGPNAEKAVSNILELKPAGIDLNCGCPESFACHRGGGSKITLENAVDVVSTISKNFDVPVSVKMRIRSTVEETVQFAQAMEQAGAKAITIHGRLAEDKRKGGPDYEHMKLAFQEIKTAAKIGNGGVNSLEEAHQMKEKTGCESVMICSAALKNPSVFATTLEKKETILERFNDIGRENKIEFIEAKWNVSQMLSGCREFHDFEVNLPTIETWDSFHQELLKYQ